MKANIRRACRQVGHNWGLYLLLLPSFLLLLIFSYKPMYGVILAFKDYKNSLGITGSPWADPLFRYFTRFFKSFQFGTTIRNTLALNLYSLLVGFPIPIFLALMINQITARRFRKGFQTVLYLPHFISTVVVAAMVTIFTSPTYGIINKFIELFGGTAVNFMMRPSCFVPIYVISGVWQNMGWNAIIYVAALAAVDPALHESAMIDGASRLQRVININIPCILPTIIVMLILQTGSLLNVGFEKVFLLSNDAVLERSEVISTYTYRIGITGAQFSQSTAIGLFNSVVQFIMLVLVNTLSRRLSETSLW